jgi:hypothetical protein
LPKLGFDLVELGVVVVRSTRVCRQVAMLAQQVSGLAGIDVADAEVGSIDLGLPVISRASGSCSRPCFMSMAV